MNKEFINIFDSILKNILSISHFVGRFLTINEIKDLIAK